MDTVLATHQLTKCYHHHVALDQVNLTLHSGDVYGLIGRNGAGKTTFMKLINRQILPTSGEVELFGQSVTRNDRTPLQIGTLIEAPGLYPNFTAYQNLQLKCQLLGIHRKHYIEEILELVELENTGRKRVKKFSLGMKQRLGLAMALIGDPDVLLLDEPTNGMDPQGMRQFRQALYNLNQERHISMIISSHILDELTKYVNRIGIIHEGQLIKEATMRELDQENQDHLTIRSHQLDRVVSYLEQTLQLNQFRVVNAHELHLFEGLDHPDRISHGLIQAGILFDHFAVNHHTLEDYFIELTGGVAHA